MPQGTDEAERWVVSAEQPPWTYIYDYRRGAERAFDAFRADGFVGVKLEKYDPAKHKPVDAT